VDTVPITLSAGLKGDEVETDFADKQMVEKQRVKPRRGETSSAKDGTGRRRGKPITRVWRNKLSNTKPNDGP